MFLSHQVFSEDTFLVHVCNFLAQILKRNHSIFLRWEDYSSFPRRVPPTSSSSPLCFPFLSNSSSFPPPPPPARRKSSLSPPWSSWKEMPLVRDLPTPFGDKVLVKMSGSNTSYTEHIWALTLANPRLFLRREHRWRRWKRRCYLLILLSILPPIPPSFTSRVNGGGGGGGRLFAHRRRRRRRNPQIESRNR